MTDIVVNKINKEFGQKSVLKDFSEVFKAGSSTCIMGASGCGKTTLLRLIAGLDTPDSGSIDGTQGKITMVFQEDRLCETLSVITNLMMIADKGSDMAAFNQRCEVLLDKLGLLSEKNSMVCDLSGGMKRRAAIARAILFGGDILLMDEPFKGLDDDIRKKTAELILNSFTEAVIIFVSHDEEEAELMNARILKLEKRKS